MSLLPPSLPPPLPPSGPPAPLARSSSSAAALIQRQGAAPAGGRASGSGSVPLERARGGDTPVLTFRVLGPAARGGGAPVRLLLDTGASATMVTPALGQRLALQPQATAAAALAGGGQDCQGLRPAQVALPPLELAAAGSSLDGGGSSGTLNHGALNHGTLSDSALSDGSAGGSVRFEGVRALMLPVAALPAGVDGVLGIPSLRQLPFRIDPAQQRLHFGAAALRGPLTPPRRLPLEWRRGVPIVQLQGPRTTVAALADTGAEGLFISPGLARSLQPRGPAERVRLVGVCGEQSVQRQALSGLSLGRLPTARPAVWEAIITANPIFALLDVEAIVGQELLRDRQQLWRLDLARPRLELW